MEGAPSASSALDGIEKGWPSSRKARRAASLIRSVPPRPTRILGRICGLAGTRVGLRNEVGRAVLKGFPLEFKDRFPLPLGIDPGL